MPNVSILTAPISVNAQRVSRAMGEIAQVIARRKMVLTELGVICQALGSFDDGNGNNNATNQWHDGRMRENKRAAHAARTWEHN